MPGVDGVLGVKGESEGIVTEGVAGAMSGSGSLTFPKLLLTKTESCAKQGPISTSSFLLAFGDVLQDLANPFCGLVPVYVSWLVKDEFPLNCTKVGEYWCRAACCVAASWWGEKK